MTASVRPIVIYVVKQQGCPACQKAEGQIEAFKKENPTQLVIELDISRLDWKIGGQKVKKTPTYFFKYGPEVVLKTEGVMTKDQMKRVVRQIRGEL